MTCGSVYFSDIRWETIIKLYYERPSGPDGVDSKLDGPAYDGALSVALRDRKGAIAYGPGR